MYLGSLCYGYALYCHLVYLAIPGTREKAKCVCYIYMQLQKVKFKSVQINMKQVSYWHFCVTNFTFEPGHEISNNVNLFFIYVC